MRSSAVHLPETIKTTCPYCGVGCGVEATIQNDAIIAVSGDQQHPANLGKLCVKGAALHETMGDHGRLLHPQVEGQQVDWPTAINLVAEKFNGIRQQYGPNAIAFYLSGQLLTEDYYVANKFAKGFIGTGNVDTNSRLCMSSAVAAYKRAFGADVVPCSYEDLELCDLLVLTGSNAAWTHPVLYRRIAAAKQRNPNMRVVVIDPRQTATCDIADLHVAIAPGTDNLLFSGLLNYLVVNKCIDTDYVNRHTEGFDRAIAAVKKLDMESIARQTRVSLDVLNCFYQWFSETDKAVTFFSQGINQSASGTDKGNAIINCHIATGRIGKVGAGPFSITGQPNAMGGREVGGLANVLAAHMEYTPENVAVVSEFWKTNTVSEAEGLKAIDLFDAVADGTIKAIWIMGTNPVVSMPNADRVKAALANCETVIVSDCVAETDTTATANILLPATGWGEKDGTVTNSERRISRQRSLLSSPGEAKHDWWILSQVAQAMGFTEAFSYRSPRDIFVEHARLSGFKNHHSRLFDISGLGQLTDDQYEQLQPVQWPVTEAQPDGVARLFGDGQFLTNSGKAQFMVTSSGLPVQSLSKEFPYALNTGRMRDQWHTMTRTGRSSRLLDHCSHPFVALHPDSASSLGLREGDLARVSTLQGCVEVEVRLDSGLGEEQLFVPIHWNSQSAKIARVDALVAAIGDPVSGQPEFKYTPASIEKIEVPCWAVVASRTKIDCTNFINWNVTPLPEQQGYLYRVALEDDFNWQDFIGHKRLVERGAAQAYEHYSETTQGDQRYICYSDKQLELAIYSHRDKQALPQKIWMQTLFSSRASTAYWSFLAGDEYQKRHSGRLICSCYKVTETQIVEAVIAGADTAVALGERLRCGTNCGSCIPELNALIAQSLEVDAA